MSMPPSSSAPGPKPHAVSNVGKPAIGEPADEWAGQRLYRLMFLKDAVDRGWMRMTPEAKTRLSAHIKWLQDAAERSANASHHVHPDLRTSVRDSSWREKLQETARTSRRKGSEVQPISPAPPENTATPAPTTTTTTSTAAITTTTAISITSPSTLANVQAASKEKANDRGSRTERQSAREAESNSEESSVPGHSDRKAKRRSSESQRAGRLERKERQKPDTPERKETRNKVEDKGLSKETVQARISQKLGQLDQQASDSVSVRRAQAESRQGKTAELAALLTEESSDQASVDSALDFKNLCKKPGNRVITLGVDAHKGNRFDGWNAFLPKQLPYIRSNPDKFIFLLEDLAETVQPQNLHLFSDQLPEALQGAAGQLTIKGLASGPLQSYALNLSAAKTQIEKGKATKETVRSLKALLKKQLPTLKNLGVAEKDIKDVIRHCNPSDSKKLCKLLGRALGSIDIKRLTAEHNSSAKSRPIQQQVLALLQEHPGKTIVVLDNLTSLHGGIRTIRGELASENYEFHKPAEIERFVEDKTSNLAIDGWVDLLETDPNFDGETINLAFHSGGPKDPLVKFDYLDLKTGAGTHYCDTKVLRLNINASTSPGTE